jgi:DNA-binding CsgD family transcriptional regulator
MRAWYEQKLKEFSGDHISDNDLHHEISIRAKSLGFDFWMLGIRLPIPFSRPAVEVCGNHPLLSQSAYRPTAFLEANPILRHCATSSIPLIWNAAAPPSESLYWSEAIARGISCGWTLPMRGRFGSLTWFSLARSSGSVRQDEFAAVESTMIWLAYFAESRIGATLARGMFDGGAPRLSTREREVMMWTADGKTASEIGEILGIAESTCIFHITNAARKLGAVNKTHAVARAAVLGLIG